MKGQHRCTEWGTDVWSPPTGVDIAVPEGKAERDTLVEQTVEEILSFLRNSDTAGEYNKRLLVSQCLCLEVRLIWPGAFRPLMYGSGLQLGLAKVGNNTICPDAAFPTEQLVTSDRFDAEPPYVLYKPDYALPDVPLTLKGCHRLLKSKGHVNILEYCSARRERMSLIRRQRQMVGNQITEEMLCSLNNQGAFAHLVQPSANCMIQ